MGFLFGGIPWYLGAFIILVTSVDHREKAGYVACSIAVSSSLCLFHYIVVEPRPYSLIFISFSCDLIFLSEIFQSIIYLIAAMLGMTGNINIW